MKNPASQCPVNHTGVELIRHSFAQVAASFEGLVTNQDHKQYVPRGGCPRPDKEPRGNVNDRWNYTRVPGYGVESTYNAEQLAYVGISTVALNKLLRGELLMPHADKPGNHVDRVVADVREQAPSHISFGGAVARSVLQTFDDFALFYPNLIPALWGMNRSGASVGTGKAVGSTDSMLSLAIRGVDPLQDNQYVTATASAARFTIQNPLTSAEKTHEVWCPAESVARRIIRDSGKAAILLSVMPEIAVAYGTPPNDPWDNDRVFVTSAVTNRIDAMYYAAVAERV